jgi:hypothetical protein
MRWNRLASAVVALLPATAFAADTLDGVELLYELDRASCEFARKCQTPSAEQECAKADKKKQEWNQAKAGGKKLGTNLERADWTQCAASVKGADCKKYPFGFLTFVSDAKNTACASYVQYTSRSGKYAPKK